MQYRGKRGLQISAKAGHSLPADAAPGLKWGGGGGALALREDARAAIGQAEQVYG